MNPLGFRKEGLGGLGLAEPRCLTGIPASRTLWRLDPSQNTWTALRSFSRTVWILLAGTFLNKFGTFVIPFLALYMTRRGFTSRDAGLAIGAYGFGQLLASLFGGHMADNLGRRRTIVLSMFSAAAAMMMLSQARSLLGIVLLTALAGLTGELYRPAGSAMLTDLVPSGRRVTAFAAYRLSFNAGWAFGPATAGFLAGYSFFWLFLGDAVTSLAYGLVAWSCLPESRPSARRPTAWGEAWASMRRDRAFQRAMVASLAITLVFLQMASSYGLFVTSLGHSDRAYGLLLSLNGVLIVCFELPLTEITRRYPARRQMAVGYLLIGGGFALNCFARTIPELIVPMVLFTAGEMITIPLFGAHIANLAPEHLRGRYMGVWAFTGALALMAGPNLGLWLFRTNPPALWLGSALLGLAAACIISFEPSGPGPRATRAPAQPQPGSNEL